MFLCGQLFLNAEFKNYPIIYIYKSNDYLKTKSQCLYYGIVSMYIHIAGKIHNDFLFQNFMPHYPYCHDQL